MGFLWIFSKFQRICKFDKIGIEILQSFVYNVFIVVLSHRRVRVEGDAFPKGV